MPKILVLFSGASTPALEALSDAARAVRFSEVDIRRASSHDEPAPTDAYRALNGAEELVPYDAIVVGASASGQLSPAIQRLLGEASSAIPRNALQNKVGAAYVSEATPPESAHLWPALSVLGDMGMLVIAPSGTDVDSARALGSRVAQVVGWVTHARSHHHHAH